MVMMVGGGGGGGGGEEKNSDSQVQEVVSCTDDKEWITRHSEDGVEFFEHGPSGMWSTSKIKASKHNAVDTTPAVQEHQCQVNPHLRRCIPKDFHEFLDSFPEFANRAHIHSTVPEKVRSDDANENEDDDATIATIATCATTLKTKTSRRFSIDEDYGFDEDALNEDEDSKCDTQ